MLGSKSFMNDFVLFSNDLTFFTYMLLKDGFSKLQYDTFGKIEEKLFASH